MTHHHRWYLRGRGFDPKALEEEWGLLGTQHLSSRWNWRIVIPVQDARGRVVAYQGRTIREGVEPKYRMTDHADIPADPRSLIYGINKTREDGVIIVEGVTGVWRLGPGAVATFGIDWKREQANQLRHFERRFIIYDPEPKAQERALGLARWLGIFPGTTEVVEGFQTDPGDFTPELARKIRRRLGF
jgi:DNA primase